LGGTLTQDLSLYFRALSDRKRLQIAQYLVHHERIPVTQLGEELRLSQPLISWHLRLMRRAGIVKTQREGRQVLCSLNRRALQSYQQRLNVLLDLEEHSNDPSTNLPVQALEPASQG